MKDYAVLHEREGGDSADGLEIKDVAQVGELIK